MSNRSKKFTDLLPDAGSSDTTTAVNDTLATPPTTVLMHTITGNPENPRQPEDYTDDDPEFAELKDTMRQVGQLQPVAVVSHAVYVRLKAEFAGAVDGAEYVVVGGNRRLAAARQLGWTRIDIRVQDRLGDDDGMFDDAVIIENIHRKKIDPVKEAVFLARMVEKHGSQEEVGRRIGKTQMYVSHRLALLKLAPEVQSELEVGTVKPSQVRGLAAKPVEEQRARVAEIKQAKPKRAAARPPVQNAVLKPAPEPTPRPAADDRAEAHQNAVLTTAGPRAVAQADSIPEPRTQRADGVEIAGIEGKSFPYDDGAMTANLLIRKMTDEEFFRMLDILNATEQRKRPTG
ncbi:ParB/RepB/Spo0J family partition protein [Streptomyces sp. NPDC057717]|uniref:ParB/RepB/Spo0J family partition protein n=1 Tax=Streptomyces sp. NPDC057717 TaxID=3346224 RepID=UPI0036D1068D